MENNENVNSNWQSPNNNAHQSTELPDSKAGFILGLIGLILSPFCCCGISAIGVILSIIGLIKSGNAIKTYDANPSAYNEADYKKAKTAKILSTIGLIVGIICFIWFIISLFINAGGMNYERMFKRMIH